MKNIKKIFVLMFVIIFFPSGSFAGGISPYNIDLSVNKVSAVGNNEDSVVITVKSWKYKCTGTPPEGTTVADVSPEPEGCAIFTPPTVTPIGVPITVAGFYLNISGSGNNQPTKQAFVTDANGYANFTLKSSTAETKNISVTFEGPVVAINTARSKTSTSVSYIQPVVNNNPVTTPTVTPKPSQGAVQTPTVAPEKPSTPKVLEVILDGQKTELVSERVPALIFDKEKGVKFSGVTIPNGKVTLYFQSEPFSDTVVAGADGAWSYLLTKDLGEGDHSLETTVTDPTTNLTSEKSTAVKFALNYSDENQNQNSPENNVTDSEGKNNNYLLYILVLILALVAAAFAIWLKVKKNKQR